MMRAGTVPERTNIDNLMKRSQILHKAINTRVRGAIGQREVIRKLTVILSVFLIGLAGLVITLLLIRWRVFAGPEQQAFAAMVALLSLGVMMFSMIGSCLTIWNAYVLTYLELRGSQVEAAEVTDQYQILVESVVTAAPAFRLAGEEIPAPARTYPVIQTLAEAVKAVARVAPAEHAVMVAAFKEAAMCTIDDLGNNWKPRTESEQNPLVCNDTRSR